MWAETVIEDTEIPWPTEPPADDEVTPRRLRPAEDTPPQAEATTWEPFNLGPYLTGDVERPEAAVGIVRSDGVRMLYPGREHAVLGETESGKSWFALGCVAAELAEDNPVVYLHFEESDPASTVERLRLLGVTPDLVVGRLRFAAPSRPLQPGWLDGLLDPAPTLVILDGINEAMSLHGNDIMAADGASSFRRRLIVPCLRAGAATLACDHLPKNTEGRGRDAYGSVHKGNAIDGARIVLENVAPFGRGLRGVSYVFVTKDRPGQLRAHGKPTAVPGKTFFGSLVVDDGPTSGADFLGFYAPREDDKPKSGDSAAELADTVHAVIAAQPDGTVAASRTLFALLRQEGHHIRHANARNAIDDLLVAGRLAEVPGPKNSRGYRAILTASLDGTS